LLVAAWQGRQDDTEDLIEATEREAHTRGEGIGLAITAYARAVLSNGHARYEDALTAAASATAYREVIAENWGLGELVEAATRCGRTDLARNALDRLDTKAGAAHTDWALGIHARGQALLADDDVADHWYRRSLDHLRRTHVQAELARTQLLYGEWLRRQGRRRDARAELNEAHERFVAMGMEAFARRAGNELVGTGEKRRAPADATQHNLTAQERHIAELVGDGLSNPQIGARLFLSPRTVEWHLRHVYSKLGIGSRRELRGVLQGHR
jgi:ATP/maltotriose-dependent transcriptional regulator MalT